LALPADNIATTTLQAIRPTIADNIFKANGTVFFLLASGRVEMASGGKRLDEPLLYAVNSTVKSYSGYDKLDISPTEEFTTAQYNWKQFAGSVSIAGLEELENDGPEAVFNLLRQKVMVLEDSMKQHLDEMVHGDVDTKNAKDFLGLDNLIEDVTGASQSTVGGIARSTYPWWRNQFLDLSGGTGLTNLTSNLRQFRNTCSKGVSSPDLIASPYTEFEAYMDQNAGKLRLQDTRLMDVGFMNAKFEGMTWIPNENCIASRIYFINTRYIRIKLHRKRNFVMTPFRTPIDQDAQVSQVLVAGNMTCNNSRFQGVIKIA
jgi:hypothetical protein